MPSLRELQTRVLDALLAASPENAIPLIAGYGGPAASRLGVYRNNVQSNFADALRSSFPVIWRLVGADYFRQTAREFQRHHPSRSGDLLHVGKRFPEYLAGLHLDDFSYLVDVARLEWLVQEALLSAEHAPLDLQKLARVAPAEYDALCFELHPALRLFESRYPALRIWESNVSSDAEAETIHLHSGGDRLAVARCRLQLQFHRLSAGEHCFLNSLSRGESFAAAVALGENSDPPFDASAALQRFVAAEAVVDFRIQDPQDGITS
jgi:putative DNA-binding protein